MTHQQYVTIAQVENKLRDAVRRNDAHDWFAWYRCLVALKAVYNA